jgi:hypothetical protein
MRWCLNHEERLRSLLQSLSIIIIIIIIITIIIIIISFF